MLAGLCVRFPPNHCQACNATAKAVCLHDLLNTTSALPVFISRFLQVPFYRFCSMLILATMVLVDQLDACSKRDCCFLPSANGYGRKRRDGHTGDYCWRFWGEFT